MTIERGSKIQGEREGIDLQMGLRDGFEIFMSLLFKQLPNLWVVTLQKNPRLGNINQISRQQADPADFTLLSILLLKI